MRRWGGAGIPGFPHFLDDITDYTWRGHKCSKCDEYWPTKPDGDGPVVKINFTSPDILWRVLQYMMGREDWNCFVFAARVSFGTYKPENDFIKHFLTDPARFVKLCAEWCREHPGSGRIQEK